MFEVSIKRSISILRVLLFLFSKKEKEKEKLDTSTVIYVGVP
jgi:hypothetical protein